LSETLVESSGASARVIFLVRPGGVTNIKVVAEAKNGDVVAGDPEDVGCMQVGKQADLQVAKSQAEEIASRLSYAFLLHSSVQRAGERVTAEEIRYMASELDDGLGGAYTLLAADFQLPAVRLFERRMEIRLKAPPIDTKLVTPVIVAGLEAIGRGHSQRNLRAFMSEIVTILTPEIAIKYLKPVELISRSAAAYSIDTEGLIPTEEEIAQNEQRALMAQMGQQLAPEVLKQGGGMMQKAMEQQAPAPAQ
ncbi:MAG: portal protein, partial [Aeromicrobium sp.]